MNSIYLSEYRILNAAKNTLTSLPEEVAQLVTLEVLHLENNKISSLPNLETLSSLSQLDLHFNSIADPAHLLHLPTSLEQLNISHNLLTAIPTQLPKVVNSNILLIIGSFRSWNG